MQLPNPVLAVERGIRGDLADQGGGGAVNLDLGVVEFEAVVDELVMLELVDPLLLGLA